MTRRLALIVTAPVWLTALLAVLTAVALASVAVDTVGYIRTGHYGNTFARWGFDDWIDRRLGGGR